MIVELTKTITDPSLFSSRSISTTSCPEKGLLP